MHWLLISVGGYLLSAVAILIDKFLLRKTIPHAAVYAFYVSVLGLLVLLIFPIPKAIPSPDNLSAGLVSGAIFTFALLVFYSLLRKNEASRVVTLVGGASPVFVLVIASLILKETLSPIQILSFFIILSGSSLLTWEWRRGEVRFGQRLFWLSLFAAFLFGLSHVLSKYVYVNYSFSSGLVLRSIGGFLGGLGLLAFRKNREKIFEALKGRREKINLLFLFGQSSGALSFIIVNYAFSLGSIAIVNALSGTQYLFVFLATLLLSSQFPHLLKEKASRGIVLQKILSLTLIIVGIALLYLSS